MPGTSVCGVCAAVTMWRTGSTCTRKERPAGVESVDGLEWISIPATWGKFYGRGPVGRALARPHYQFSAPFLREIERDPPDLFVFYGNVPTPFSLVVARRLTAMGVPYAVTVHTRLENLFGADVTGKPVRRLAAWLAGAPLGREAPPLFGRAEAIILLTQSDREEAIRRAIARPERIQVIPSGVSETYFHPGPDEEKGPYPSLCFVGRMEDAKGFLEAVRCLAAVREEQPKAQLHVAGAWTSDAYMREAMAAIRAGDLEEAVVQHGWLGPEDLGNLYRRSHLLLFPSKREGLPRAVIEAMMCGVPAAAVRGTGGHGDLIEDGRNGVLAAAGDWEGEVVRLLRQRDRVDAMSRQAGMSVRTAYSMDAMFDRVEALYLGITNREG